jgi:hypothetical protein
MLGASAVSVGADGVDSAEGMEMIVIPAVKCTSHLTETLCCQANRCDGHGCCLRHI